MNIKKLFLALFVGVFITAHAAGSVNATVGFKTESFPIYADYRDIPGVTKDEIAAVEALRARSNSFIYGMVNLTTEAFYDENGEIGGYSRLFCGWLTELFKIRFTPALYSRQDLLDGLESKVIDFSGELSATPELRGKYFMTSPIAERPVKVMRIAGSESLERIEQRRPIRYAFLKDATTYQRAMPFLRIAEPQLIDSYSLAYRALSTGDIDAFLAEGCAEAGFDLYGNVRTELFFPLIRNPVSLSTRNPEFASIISIVEKALNSGSSRQLAQLYNQGQRDYLRHKLLAGLGAAEREYLLERITSGRPVPVAVEHDNYPASFYNAHDQAWQGIALDVLKEIRELTGLDFARANTEPVDWSDLLSMLRSGEAAMITELLRTEDREGNFIWADTPLQSDSYVLLSRIEFPDLEINEVLNASVGLIEDTAYSAKFRFWFPDHPQTVGYPNTHSALDALDRGEVDMVMATRSQLLSLTNFYERTSFKANLVLGGAIESIYGFNRNEAVLASIVSKAMLLVDTRRISERWNCKVFDYNAGLTRAQRPWLLGSIFLLLCIMALLFSIFLRNKQAGITLERIVRERTRKLTAVIENYSGVIWSVDKDKIITTFNGQYLKTIGVTPDFLEGKSLRLARGKNRHLDVIEKVEQTLDTATAQDWVGEIDGRMFHSHTTPIFDDAGKAIAVVGSTDDITDTIRLQKDLEMAVIAAEAANRAKSDFLSNMSHEVRTPMNAIIGMTTIGKSASNLKKKNYAFGRIEDASTHLLGVINDVLDMSKIEAGKFELSPTEFNFEKMLRKAVNVVNFRVDEKSQDFSVHIDKEIPVLLVGDDQRLIQVITNLLSNAVKFTPEGGVIHLNAGMAQKENRTVTLRMEVIDTGIGVTEEQTSRLFKSFQQAENSTTRKFGGTGLGLAISKRIVEMMGGEIWVESEPGKGSTFIFTIQAGIGADAQCESVRVGQSYSGIRVLVVDDSPEVLEYFEEIAGQIGFICDVAGGGDEALARIEANDPYDICFIDWKMPGMDGIELTRRIKAGGGKTSAVTMISSAQWSILEEEAKNAGVDKFLLKPFFPSSIVDCINESLGLDKAVQQEAAATENFAGHQILLAEDVEINREIVLSLLESTGLDIDCAENGAVALSMFSAAPDRYEMIFMDVQMPEMDGYEATRRIRALDAPRAGQVPIIAMTANVFREDIEKCLDAGMNDHVGKPLDMGIVLDKLRKYLPTRPEGV